MKRLAFILLSVFALSETLIIQNVFADINQANNKTEVNQKLHTNNHLHNNNRTHIKTTVIDAGLTESTSKSKSKSNASANLLNISPSNAKSKATGGKSNSGGNVLKTGKTQHIAPAHMHTGGATHGVNLGVGGFQWKSLKGQAYTGGFLTAAEKKENYCLVTLSRSQARELPMCKAALRASRELVGARREDSFDSRDDH